MRLNQFQYLMALKEQGSFSGAAQKLYTSQPSISNAIKELESELDCQLLIRDNRGVIFTPKGDEILEQAAIILDAVQDICRIAGADTSFDRALRIGSTPHLCNQILLRTMVALVESHPHLELKLEEGVSDSLLDMVYRCDLDFALVQLCNIPVSAVEKARKLGVHFDELFQDKLFFACRLGHPLLQQENVTVEDILKFPFVSYHDTVEDEIQTLFDRYQYRQQITHISEIVSLRKFVTSTDNILSQTYASMNNGNRIFADQLAPVTPENISWDVSVCLVHKGSSLSSAECIVRDEVRRQCRESLEYTSSK